MANGIWGIIAVGLFATPDRLEQAYGNSDHVGWFYSFGNGGHDATLLGTQFVGLLFILGWVTGLMLPFFVWLDWKGWFRSDPLEEIVGLDLSYHGGAALGGQCQPEYITNFTDEDGNISERPKRRNIATSQAETLHESLGDIQSEHADVSEPGAGTVS
jgi:hypothetical protein